MGEREGGRKRPEAVRIFQEGASFELVEGRACLVVPQYTVNARVANHMFISSSREGAISHLSTISLDSPSPPPSKKGDLSASLILLLNLPSPPTPYLRHVLLCSSFRFFLSRAKLFPARDWPMDATDSLNASSHDQQHNHATLFG